MNAPVRYTQGAKLFLCILFSVGLSAFIYLLTLILDVYQQGFIDSIN